MERTSTDFSMLFVKIICLNIEISSISQSLHAPIIKHSFQHSYFTLLRQNSVSCVTWIRQKFHVFKLIAMKTKLMRGFLIEAEEAQWDLKYLGGKGTIE